MTAAIFYSPDAYSTRGKRLLGRQSAGEGFLKSFVQQGAAEAIYCYAHQETDFSKFCDLIRPWVQHPQKVRWVRQPHLLAEPGAIYRPDPVLAEMLWMRRFGNQRAYSVCGITHTIGTKLSMQAIGDLMIAPFQPWDALICTSQAVKVAVEDIWETWVDYLRQRLGSHPPHPFRSTPGIKLPVIPLGVDAEGFPQGDAAINTRQRLRQALNIPQNDLVVLFMGRISFSAKAHPVPMYMALEKAAKVTGAKIHLILAGWIEDPREEPHVKQSVKIFCPSINTLWVDGRLPSIRTDIWCTADIFISLSDNIQETFGLTPIEAMSNGLPVVVSDWNGYQESVRQDIDGFKIPTLIPPPHCCQDLVMDYLNNTLNWPTFMGHTSMVVSVDIEACAKALIQLIQHPELRQKMGENGRQRVQEIYDWKRVIAAYETLWHELAEIRFKAEEALPSPFGVPPYPLCDDPFRRFSHYSTEILSHDIILSLGENKTPAQLQEMQNFWITRFGLEKRTPATIQGEILAAIETAGALRVEEILNRFAANPQEAAILTRTLVYLLKFNILTQNFTPQP